MFLSVTRADQEAVAYVRRVGADHEAVASVRCVFRRPTPVNNADENVKVDRGYWPIFVRTTDARESPLAPPMPEHLLLWPRALWPRALWARVGYHLYRNCPHFLNLYH